MTSSLLKIIQLANGDIALQPSDEEEQPLVTISFSELSKDYIGNASLDVAKVMIQAGIQAVAQITEAQVREATDAGDDVISHTLH